MKARVAVTGMGIVSALGVGLEANRAALETGRSGIRRLRQFPAQAFPVAVGGEVERPGLPAGTGRIAALAELALEEALQDSGLPCDGEPRREVATCWALGKPTLDLPRLRDWLADGATRREGEDRLAWLRRRYASDLRREGHTTADVLARLAQRGGAGGERMACYTACASGNDALGLGKRLIERGAAEVVVAGGADAQLDPLSLLEYELLAALAPMREGQEPAKLCRPFDRRRTGFVVGEGAATLILESEAHARRRGARVRGWLSGHGSSLDAFGLTKCHPKGQGAARAMEAALADAGRAPEEIGYINAHGTGTVLNDKAEAAGIHAIWGAEAERVPISSTKAMTGHLIAAAAAVEAVLTLTAMERGFLPPSLNYEEFDPECALNVVTSATPQRFRRAISNGFGFGGQNACVVMEAA